jgi:hypothetical protein
MVDDSRWINYFHLDIFPSRIIYHPQISCTPEKLPSWPALWVPFTAQAKSRHLWGPVGPSRAGCHVPQGDQRWSSLLKLFLVSPTVHLLKSQWSWYQLKLVIQHPTIFLSWGTFNIYIIWGSITNIIKPVTINNPLWPKIKRSSTDETRGRSLDPAAPARKEPGIPALCPTSGAASVGISDVWGSDLWFGEGYHMIIWSTNARIWIPGGVRWVNRGVPSGYLT